MEGRTCERANLVGAVDCAIPAGGAAWGHGASAACSRSNPAVTTVQPTCPGTLQSSAGRPKVTDRERERERKKRNTEKKWGSWTRGAGVKGGGGKGCCPQGKGDKTSRSKSRNAPHVARLTFWRCSLRPCPTWKPRRLLFRLPQRLLFWRRRRPCEPGPEPSCCCPQPRPSYRPWRWVCGGLLLVSWTSAFLFLRPRCRRCRCCCCCGGGWCWCSSAGAAGEG